MFLGVSPDEEEMYRLLLRRGGFSRTDLERHLQQDAREGDAPDAQTTYQHMIDLGWQPRRQADSSHLFPPRPKLWKRSSRQGRPATRRAGERSGQQWHRRLAAWRTRKIPGRQRSTRPDRWNHHAAHRRHGRSASRHRRTHLLHTHREPHYQPTGVLSQENISHARVMDSRILRRNVHMRTLMQPPQRSMTPPPPWTTCAN